jgi:hypothetical protein
MRRHWDHSATGKRGSIGVTIRKLAIVIRSFLFRLQETQVEWGGGAIVAIFDFTEPVETRV